MRRKLGIFFLIAVTVLAGTQEAARQFDGLKSSMGELTRAGLWSGLIVYAQPVSNGKLPSPQIYYLMPQPQSAPGAPEGALLVENRPNDNTATPKPEAKNNHTADETASNTDAAATAAAAAGGAAATTATREVEDAARAELVMDKLPLNLIASHLAPPPPPAAPAAAAAVSHQPPPKLEKRRVYVQVAKNESFARKFRQDADVIAKAFVKEFDAAKLEAELTRLAAVQEQLETSKLKSSVEPGKDALRRIELRVMRRAARPERTERPKVSRPFAEKRAVVFPDMSSIGCEKPASAKPAAAAAAAAAVAVMPSVTMEVKIAAEPLNIELAAPAAIISIPASTNWALGCDNEPEQK